VVIDSKTTRISNAPILTEGSEPRPIEVEGKKRAVGSACAASVPFGI
jgi:hypothetical protein